MKTAVTLMYINSFYCILIIDNLQLQKFIQWLKEAEESSEEEEA